MTPGELAGVVADRAAAYLRSTQGSQASVPSLGALALSHSGVLAALTTQLLVCRRLFRDDRAPCATGCGHCGPCLVARAELAALFTAPDSVTVLVGREAAPAGVVYFTDHVPGREAQLHCCFLDGDLWGRGALLAALMAALDVARVYAAVPAYAETLARFARHRLGMTGVARYPDRVTWQGRLWDVSVLERWYPERGTES